MFLTWAHRAVSWLVRLKISGMSLVWLRSSLTCSLSGVAWDRLIKNWIVSNTMKYLKLLLPYQYRVCNIVLAGIVQRVSQQLHLQAFSGCIQKYECKILDYFSNRTLSHNAETKDFARLTSHSVRGWTGKNKLKLFILLGLKMAAAW